MATLLIQNIDEATKRSLAARAAHHGRSEEAEALAILKEALNSKENWYKLLRSKALSVDGIDFPEPKRRIPRYTELHL